MLNVFKRRTPIKELMYYLYDVHSHLLPGVDDGSASMDQSRELINEMSKLGVKAMYSTPHIIADSYPLNNNESLREQFSIFEKEIRPKMDIRLAAEYLLDEAFVSHLDNKPLLLGDKHILVEFTMGGFTANTFETLFEITLRGYTPVIAHPERYRFITMEKGGVMLTRLLDAGCKMQLNLLSLCGWHGESACRFSQGMLEHGVYDFVGSDIHAYHHLNAIKTLDVSRKHAQMIDKLKLNNVTLFRD